MNGPGCAPQSQFFWRQGDPAFGSGYYCANISGNEHMYPEDLASDGRSVGIIWELRNAGTLVRKGICRNPNGAGTLADCGYLFPEGLTLRMKLGRCDADGEQTDGVPKSCKQLSHWTNLGNTWHVSKT